MTSIGDCTFSGCSSLTSVSIPKGMTSIGDYAFQDCGLITSVTIPESVTSIGKYAFENCCSLVSVVIPKGVTSIGEGVVAGCSSLTAIGVFPDNLNYTSSDGVLYSKDMCKLLAYPGAKTSYVIPEGVTNIGNYQ